MSKESNRNVYVGHRYVPKIMGEWDNQNDYEGLSIVTHQGTSYTSKKRVPVGIDILNEEFWVVTGNYNAQVENYRDEVRNLSDDVTDIDNKLINKTDKTYVDTELGKKSDKTYVDNELDNKVTKNDLKVNIKDFKLSSDDPADDTESFKRAINFIDQRGGGTLVLPSAVTILKPENNRPLQLCSNLIIEGEGTSSIVKVHPGTGDYWALFGQLTATDEKLENVTFRDFRIDQNPSGNLNVNVSNENDKLYNQFAISMWNFDHITVDSILFSPCTGTNTITMNRGYANTGKRSVINNNTFEFSRSIGDSDYDNSAIYTNVDGAIVTNNKFYASQGTRARGCIETHGGHSILTGNYSDGYYTGVNVVGRLQTNPSNINITGNNFNNVARGIQLWVHDGILSNVNISSNVFTVNPERYDLNAYAGIFSAGSTADENRMKQINIKDNTITFKNHNGNTSNGINLRLSHDIQGLSIADNFISGANNNGIALGTPTGGSIKDGLIIDNFILDCVLGGSAQGAYIKLSGLIENFTVKGNKIVNRLKESLAINAIDAVSGTFTDTIISDNDIKSDIGSLYSNISGTITVDFKEVITIPENGMTREVISNQIVIEKEGNLPVLKRSRFPGTIGDINHNLILTYNLAKNCYIANDSTGIVSGTWLLINDTPKKVRNVIGNEIYILGSAIPDVSEQTVELYKAELVPVPNVIQSLDKSLYMLTVTNDGIVGTAKL